MTKRLRLVPIVLVAFLVLPGCKGSQNMMDQASGLMQLANGIPEISQFMGLAQMGGLAGMLGGGSPFTLLAPSDDAISALGEETLDRLKSPEGADQLKGLLERHLVPGSVGADDLGDRLGGASILKSEEGDGGLVHVINQVLPAG